MFINLSPLKKNKQYRILFIGQTVSFLGSMMTYVSVPFQVYELTKSSFWVGLVSAVQLVPLVLAGLYGGALADSMDRKKLLIYSEFGLFFCALGFIINSLFAEPSFLVLLCLAGLGSALTGIHRPAVDALLPQIIEKKDMTAVAALGSLRYSIGAIVGPSIAGMLFAKYGVVATYSVDAATFLFSIGMLFLFKSVPLPNAKRKADLSSIAEGLHYAKTQPIILGSYVVDIVAMVFAMPMALYPQIADELNQKPKLGWLYAAIPLGAGTLSLFSKLLDKINRQGAGVIISAAIWGGFVFLMSFAPSIEWKVFCLFCAGAADSVSAIYRQTIWNDIIPANMRGRMGSLNILSYMIGPLAGNVFAGGLASATTTQGAVFFGGALCVFSCLSAILIFPKFWQYLRSE